MKKIAIIGSPGAGKTTLASTLHHELNIKVYYLDRLFWKTGWQSIDGDTRIDTMQSLIREKQWIIEGTYICSSEPRLNDADTIIFLDIAPLVCLWRVIKRHYKDSGHSRRDIPDGCVDNLNLHRMLRLLAFSMQDRRKLKQKLRTYKSKQIIRLRTSNDVDAFLAQLEQKVNTTEASSPVKERCLTTTKSLKGLLSDICTCVGKIANG